MYAADGAHVNGKKELWKSASEYQSKTRRDRQIKAEAKKRELYEYRKEHKDKLAMLNATCLCEEEVLTRCLQDLQSKRQAHKNSRLPKKLRHQHMMGD